MARALDVETFPKSEVPFFGVPIKKDYSSVESTLGFVLCLKTSIWDCRFRIGLLACMYDGVLEVF